MSHTNRPTVHAHLPNFARDQDVSLHSLLGRSKGPNKPVCPFKKVCASTAHLDASRLEVRIVRISQGPLRAHGGPS